jgi:hypothetical protein
VTCLEPEEELALGEEIYRSLVRADPTPGDLEWDELDGQTQWSYAHAAAHVITSYLALRHSHS